MLCYKSIDGMTGGYLSLRHVDTGLLGTGKCKTRSQDVGEKYHFYWQ